MAMSMRDYDLMEQVREEMQEEIREVREEGIEQGIERGREEGREQGREEGRVEGRINTISRMLKNSLPIEVIQSIMECTIEDINEVKLKYGDC